jgi:hypothetical protein
MYIYIWLLILVVNTVCPYNYYLHGALSGPFSDLHGPPVFNTFQSYPIYPSYPRVTVIHQSGYLRHSWLERLCSQVAQNLRTTCEPSDRAVHS